MSLATEISTKRCPRCKTSKPLTEFHRCRSRKDGYAGWCAPCQRQASAAWDRSPEGKEANRKKYLRDRERHIARARRNLLKRKYGITKEEYDEMAAAQRGVCAICNGPDPDGRDLAVDHDHETGHLRALLCRRCNTLLGAVADSPALLQRAAAYLHDFQKGVV